MTYFSGIHRSSVNITKYSTEMMVTYYRISNLYQSSDHTCKLIKWGSTYIIDERIIADDLLEGNLQYNMQKCDFRTNFNIYYFSQNL